MSGSLLATSQLSLYLFVKNNVLIMSQLDWMTCIESMKKNCTNLIKKIRFKKSSNTFYYIKKKTRNVRKDKLYINKYIYQTNQLLC